MSVSDIRERIPRIPANVERLYEEVLTALHCGLNVLCAAGLRVILEQVSAPKSALDRTLKARVGFLVHNEWMPPEFRERLKGVLSLGNSSIHEGAAVQRIQVEHATAIIERLLIAMYSDTHIYLDEESSGVPTILTTPSVGHDRSVGRSRHRRLFPALPTDLDVLYGEALAAFNLRLDVLCWVSIRVLVEMSCNECLQNQSDDDTLPERVEEFGRVLLTEFQDWYVPDIKKLCLVSNEAIHESRLGGDVELDEGFKLIEFLLGMLNERALFKQGSRA